MPQIKRPIFLVGNWKMNKTIAEAIDFVSGLAPLIKSCPLEIGLAIPFTMIYSAANAAKGTTVLIGAQNISAAEEGAFTGEISARLLQDAGASFVIIGHSERRQLLHETDEFINKKVKIAVKHGLRTIVGIGETLQQHQMGETESILKNQLLKSLQGLTAEQMKLIIVAYEPVWAIGSNQPAPPQGVQKIHKFCREQISDKWGVDVANSTMIQYGGSVNPDNAAALLEQPDIDGLLIGGAALSLDSFNKIIERSCTVKCITDR